MTYPLTTTLARIKAANLWPDAWARVLAAAGKTEADDDLILFSEIINAVGIEDALWCCRAEPQHSREWRLFAVWCARPVHLMTDQRSLDALDIPEYIADATVGDALDDYAATDDYAAYAVVAAARRARDAEWHAQRNAFMQLCTDGTLPTT